MDIQLDVGLIMEASAQTRTVSGLLLPYGEEGHSNLGRTKVRAHAVSFPSDTSAMVANLDHKRERPVAPFTSLTDTPTGLMASWTIAKTPDGDALLADLSRPVGERKRSRLSAEVRDIVIRGGEIIAGTLFGSAFLEAGAYPSATLLAADVGTAPAVTATTTENPEGVTMQHDPNNLACTCGTETCHNNPAVKEAAAVAAAAAAAASATGAQPAAEPAKAEPVPLLAGAVPMGAPSAAATRIEARPRGNTLQQVSHAVAMFCSTGDRRHLNVLEASELDGSIMFAALNDVKISGVGEVGTAIMQPQWVGKVWADRSYVQRFVPLLRPQTLTSLEIRGWDWTTKPKGAAWAGNKTDVPTNAPATAQPTATAERWAMGHDHAREFLDFPQPGYWESYFQAGVDDFALWEDEKALAALIALATAGAADHGAVPATWAGDIGTVMLVDGALKLNDRHIAPEFALVGSDLYRNMLLQDDNQVIDTLSLQLKIDAGDLENFHLVPAPTTYEGGAATGMAGKVLVGAQGAMSHYRLPGESPIRTRALDQIRGGIDDAMFGYAANFPNKAAALQLVNQPVI